MSLMSLSDLLMSGTQVYQKWKDAFPLVCGATIEDVAEKHWELLRDLAICCKCPPTMHGFVTRFRAGMAVGGVEGWMPWRRTHCVCALGATIQHQSRVSISSSE